MSHIKNWIDKNPEIFKKINEAPDDSDLDRKVLLHVNFDDDEIEKELVEQKVLAQEVYNQWS